MLTGRVGGYPVIFDEHESELLRARKSSAARFSSTRRKVSKVESCEAAVTLIELVAFCRILKVPVTRLLESMQ